jgi:hypothetical protein
MNMNEFEKAKAKTEKKYESLGKTIPKPITAWSIRRTEGGWSFVTWEIVNGCATEVKSSVGDIKQITVGKMIDDVHFDAGK